MSTAPLDKSAPTLASFTSGTIDPSGNLVLTFSEAVTAGTGNIVISDGSSQSYFSGGVLRTRLVGASDTRSISISDPQVTISGNTVTINLAADLQHGARYSVQMAAGVLQDLAGNAWQGLADSSKLTFLTSAASPGVAVGSTINMTDTGVLASDYITNATSQVFSGTLSGALSAGERVQVSLDGGASWQTASVSGATWSHAATIAASGSVMARVSNLAGYASAAGSQSFVLDTSQPAPPVITLNDAMLAAGESALVTVAFKEKVSGLSAADFTVSGGTLGVLASADGGQTWTGTLTPTAGSAGNGSVQLQLNTVADLAGNTGPANTAQAAFAYDTAAPTLAAISVSDTALASGETATVTVTFSEQVTGLAAADFSVSGGTLGAFASTDGGLTWSATLTPAAQASGTGSIVLASGTVADLAGNAGPAAASSPAAFSYNTYTTPAALVASVAMTDTGSSSTDFITNATGQTITGTLSGALAGGEFVQVSLDNGVTWHLASTSGSSFSYSGSIGASGTLLARVANGGGLSSSAQSRAYTLDQAAPGAPSITLGDSSLDQNQNTTVTIAFGEKVSGLAASDFSVSGGSLGAFSSADGGLTWSATLTPSQSGNGNGSIALAANSVADLAGNAGPATSASATFSYSALASGSSYIIASATAAFASGSSSYSGQYHSESAGEVLQVSYDGLTWHDAAATSVGNNTYAWSYNGAAGGHYIATRLLDASATPVEHLGYGSAVVYFGSSGNDTINISSAHAIVYSGAGSDNITVGHHAHVVTGGGSSIVYAGDYADVQLTQIGSTIVTSGLGLKLVTGAGGYSILIDRLDVTSIQAGSGNDTLNLNFGGQSFTLAELHTTRDMSGINYLNMLGANNVITVDSAADVTALSDGNLLLIAGSSNTTVRINTAVWSEGATSAGYRYFHPNGDTSVKLAVQVGMTVTPAAAAPTALVGSAISLIESGASGDYLTNVASQTFSGTYSGTLGAGDRVEVSLDDGVSWQPATASANTWSYSATIDASGTVQARVANSANLHTAAQSQAYTLDTAAPTLVSLALSDTLLTTGETATLSVTFSEAVSGLSASDFEYGGGALGAFSSANGGLTWTATVTPDTGVSGFGSIGLNGGGVTDLAGNSGPASASPPVSFDLNTTSAPPGTWVTALGFQGAPAQAQPNYANASALPIAGTLSGELAVGESVQVSTDSGVTWHAASVSGASFSYAPALAPSGTMIAHVVNHNGPSAPLSHSYVLDVSAPTLVSWSLADPALKSGQSTTLTLVFSEALSDVLDPAFSTTHGSLENLQTSDRITWTATLTPAGEVSGTGGILLQLGSAADRAGNAVASWTTINFALDTLSPTVTLTISDNTLLANQSATVTATFSEAVSGVAAAATVDGGTLATPFASLDGGRTWTATLAPSINGAANGRVTLALDAITDAAGNTGPATEASVDFAYDTQAVAPALTLASTALSADHGADAHDFITSDGHVSVGGAFSGTLIAAMGAKIETSTDNGATWSAATVDNESHSWHSAVLDLAGSGTLKVRLTTATGATQVQEQAYTIDTSAPGSLAAYAPVLYGHANDTGASSSDGITNQTWPTVLLNLSNAALADGDTLQLYDTISNTVLASRSVSAADFAATASNFTMQVSALAQGDYLLALRAVDLAGNIGARSETPLAVTLDTTTPTLVSVTPAPSASAVLPGQAITLTFSEPVELGAGAVSFRIRDTTTNLYSDVSVATAGGHVSSSGNTVTIRGLESFIGAHTYAISVVGYLADSAGNIVFNNGDVLTTFTVAARPATPSLLYASNGFDENVITNNNGLVTVGNLDSSHAEYSTNGGGTWTTLAISGGSASFILAPGSYSDGNVVVRQYDNLDNISQWASIALPLTVDTTAPTAYVSGYPSFFGLGSTPFDIGPASLGGVVASGDYLQYTKDNGATWHFGGMLSGDTWSLNGLSLPNGGAVGLRVADQAGNLGGNAALGLASGYVVYVGDGDGGSYDAAAMPWLHAGGGNDTVALAALPTGALSGGSGSDTLSLSGSGLNLTAALAQLTSFETIHLGSGNTLSLTPAQVAALSDTDILAVDLGGTLSLDHAEWSLSLGIGGWDTYVNINFPTIATLQVHTGSGGNVVINWT